MFRGYERTRARVEGGEGPGPANVQSEKGGSWRPRRRVETLSGGGRSSSSRPDVPLHTPAGPRVLPRAGTEEDGGEGPQRVRPGGARHGGRGAQPQRPGRTVLPGPRAEGAQGRAGGVGTDSPPSVQYCLGTAPRLRLVNGLAVPLLLTGHPETSRDGQVDPGATTVSLYVLSHWLLLL